MTADQIAAAIAAHKVWLEGRGGKRADMRGANMRGADMQGANMRGANMQGANMRDADMRDADMRDADMQGADMRGADMQGADMQGAKIGNGQVVISLLRRATRSDGYEFFLWHCKEGFYVQAGCRFFSYIESRQHWDGKRVGEDLGDETQDILDMFNKAIFRTTQK
jgi:hypothetical protein